MADDAPAEDPTNAQPEQPASGGEITSPESKAPTPEEDQRKSINESGPVPAKSTTDEKAVVSEHQSRKSIGEAQAESSKSKSVTEAKTEMSERKSLTASKSGVDKAKSKSITDKPAIEGRSSTGGRASLSEPRKSITEGKPSSEIKNEEEKLSGESSAQVEGRSSIDRRRSQQSKSKTDTSKTNALDKPEPKRSGMSLSTRVSKDASKDMFGRRKSSRSIGKAMGSIISFRRGSIAEYFDRQKTAKFMNTYKLDSEKPFNVDKVENILKEVLIEALDNLTYDAEKVPKQAKWASSAIRTKVKEQEYDRYKLICNVTIGEKRSQDMFATYRFLWDAERDKHASYVHENMYVFAVAVCFGIYYE